VGLAVHIWAGVFVNLGGAHSLWLINEGRMGYFSVSTALGAFLNVALNVLLIPRFGATGAAIATLVSYGATVAVISTVYRPTRPLGKMIFNALLLRR
jgi:PST family polysaccharide transporter